MLETWGWGGVEQGTHGHMSQRDHWLNKNPLFTLLWGRRGHWPGLFCLTDKHISTQHAGRCRGLRRLRRPGASLWSGAKLEVCGRSRSLPAWAWPKRLIVQRRMSCFQDNSMWSSYWVEFLPQHQPSSHTFIFPKQTAMSPAPSDPGPLQWPETEAGMPWFPQGSLMNPVMSLFLK